MFGANLCAARVRHPEEYATMKMSQLFPLSLALLLGASSTLALRSAVAGPQPPPQTQPSPLRVPSVPSVPSSAITQREVPRLPHTRIYIVRKEVLLSTGAVSCDNAQCRNNADIPMSGACKAPINTGARLASTQMDSWDNDIPAAFTCCFHNNSAVTKGEVQIACMQP